MSVARETLPGSVCPECAGLMAALTCIPCRSIFGKDLKKLADLIDGELMRKTSRAVAVKAKRLGILVQKPCEKCGGTDVEMHHEDYGRPIDITWLCRPCHMIQHQASNPVDTKRLCLCGKPARVGQRNCHRCAAKANAAYRQRQAAKRAAEQAAYLRLIAESAKSQEQSP